MIASWPGKIKPGSGSDHISSFQDLLPTLCEITGATIPEGVDGISYLPELLGSGKQEKHPYLYWEFPGSGGQQAVRMGPWKAIRTGIHKGNLELELYNLEADIREEENVATSHPNLIKEMELVMSREHVTSELERFFMEALDN